MALFRPIEPPRRNALFLEQVDWAAYRDPLGHRVHLVVAIIALAMIPLSSTLATVGSSVLFVYAALRAPSIHRTWRPLTNNACLLACLGLFIWLAITLAWSSDPQHGARLLRGSRYLLLIPALLPLLRHANLLLYGICAGVLIQNVVQWFEVDGKGGLSEHPGHTALWFTLATALLVLLPSSSNQERNGLFRRMLAVVPMVGIVLSAARSALGGCVLGLLFGMVLTCVKRRPDRIAAVVSGSLVLLIGVALSLSPWTAMNSGMQKALDAVAESQTSDVVTHRDNVRPLWWKIGLKELQEHPLTGIGLGSAKDSITNDEEVLEITKGGTTNLHALRDDYHSLFVTVAAESGVIGLLLLLGWLVLLARQILRSGQVDAVLLAGLVSFLVYSSFNTTIFSGRLVAFAAILMAFSTCRLPEQTTVHKATSDTT